MRNRNEIKTIPIDYRQDLNEIFPFQKRIFSEYRESRYGNVVETYYVNEYGNDLENFFNRIKTNVINDIMNRNINIIFNLEILMGMPGRDEQIQFYIQTTTRELLKEDDRNEFYLEICDEIRTKIETQEIRGSGWSFVRPIQLLMKQNIYNMFNGGSYIELPGWIQRKNAIINVR